MTNDEIPNDEGSPKSKGRVQWFRISGFCIHSSFLHRLHERAIPLCGKRLPLNRFDAGLPHQAGCVVGGDFSLTITRSSSRVSTAAWTCS